MTIQGGGEEDDGDDDDDEDDDDEDEDAAGWASESVVALETKPGFPCWIAHVKKNHLVMTNSLPLNMGHWNSEFSHE